MLDIDKEKQTALKNFPLFFNMNITSHLHSTIFVVTTFVMGIWWQTAPLKNQLPLVISLCVTTMALYRFKKRKTKYLFFLFLCFSFSLGSTLYFRQQKNHRLIQKKICGYNCDIRGKITSIEKSKQNYIKQVIKIELSDIKIKNSWKTVTGTIQIYVQKKEDLQIHDKIEMHNLLFKKQENLSFDQFLMRNNIIATTFQKKLDYTVLSRPHWSFSRCISHKKKKLYSSLQNKMSPATFSLFSSIFFGNKTSGKYFFEKSKEQFKQWGILHFIARSGLHLMIFIVLWEFLVGLVPTPFIPNQLIFILLGIIYCFLSWTSISFLRAFSIFLAYKTSPLFYVRANFIHLLSLICLVMLIHNPVQLFFLDFQLSFVLTFALSWFGQQQWKKRRLLQNC